MKALLVVAACLFAVEALADDSQYLPDPKKTPGAIMASCTLKDAQTPNYTKVVRNVPASLAKKVYASYGQQPGKGLCKLDSSNQGCEVDHLISLVLCGDNVQENLWVQPYHGPCNAHDKDALEVRLHKMVMANQIDLKVAQQAIRTNWIEAYRKYVGPLTCS